MTPLSRMMALFPAILLGLVAADLLWLIFAPGILPVLGLPLLLYGLPLACFRLHERLHPVTQGRTNLAGADYSAWWGGHQLQWIYLAFPALETVLRAVPGLFSAWLRAWGSTIGDGVYWTPELTIADRSLLQIGDGVIFGQRVALTAHLIKPADGGKLHCIVRKVVVGERAFVGAGSTLGPGAVIAPGSLVPTGTLALFGRTRRGLP
jgi:hypothetical protein